MKQSLPFYTLWITPLFLGFYGCGTQQESPLFTPNTGQIQVLNGCGISGAADLVRNYLTTKGFDVVEYGNADYWNYEETVVVARTHNPKIARKLAKALKAPNFIQIIDSSQLVDATVYVGKDFYQLIHYDNKHF
jgi:hypothetical protein